MIELTTLALVLAIIAMVASFVLVAQILTLKHQMDRFAGEWREEMIEIVRKAAQVAQGAEVELATTRDLVDLQRSDLLAADRATRSVLKTVAWPFLVAGRLRLGIRRSKEVFTLRRRGSI